MANLAIVGTQWGDEGKGKIVDLLCEHFDVVARYQGGHNAGHTVKIGERQFVMHLIPSGILHPGKFCVIGNGVVIDPEYLLNEMAQLESLGISFNGRLLISNRAHLILPYHRAVEKAAEEALGDRKIGTTFRGIGPCYEDKAARVGIRVCDLFYPEVLHEKVFANVKTKNTLLAALYHAEPLDAASIYDSLQAVADKLQPYVADTAMWLDQAMKAGKRLLFEGAQAIHLDLDHGTYPFVTSSSAGSGGALTGTGVAPTRLHGVIGVAKAYATRVGGGPFPTEVKDAAGEELRRRGYEYGASTGRPRRCGWFDVPAVRYARAILGADALAITKIDVLDVFKEIPVCVGYRYKNSDLKEMPAETYVLAEAQPVYKNFPGWQKSTVGITALESMPQAAQDYLKVLSEMTEAEIAMVSTGPERNQTIVKEGSSILKLIKKK
ncbi:MAG: adenylosuccinate synthase [Acidobacteriia bacterium]|nr:adenylosuccinate synthase [Terriglobia bacterium]